MSTLPPLNEGELDLLGTYSPRSDEEMTVAIVNAFEAAHIDVFERSTKLVDWIDAAVFDALQWTADRPLYVSAHIWGHPVVITAEEVRIYTVSRSFTE